MATYIKGAQPNNEIYWEKVHNICTKAQNFDLIIDLASSMNNTAQLSSLFIKQSIKKAYDSLISETQVLSRNNYKDFNLQEYRLKLIRILQLVKNEIDPKKEPLFYENIKSEFNCGQMVKMTAFSNMFTIVKIRKNKIICKNNKGKFLKFDSSEIENV